MICSGRKFGVPGIRIPDPNLFFKWVVNIFFHDRSLWGIESHHYPLGLV